MRIDFDAVLEPRDPRHWITFGHANEHNLVAQEEFIIKMRRFRYLSALNNVN